VFCREQDARTAKRPSSASPLPKRDAVTAANKLCKLSYLNTEGIYIHCLSSTNSDVFRERKSVRVLVFAM
jgi:hypothetical protein